MSGLGDADRLVEAIRLLERSGIIDFNGHVSLRQADGGLSINSGRSNRACVTAADIVTVDRNGAVPSGTERPPMELPLHAEIYRARPDVQAIVHAHPQWSTLLSMTGRPYEPVFAQGTLPGHVPIFPDTFSVNTGDRGRRVAAALGDGRALMLRSHGTVVVGGDLLEATVLALYLEDNARRQCQAALLGPYHVLSEGEVREAHANLWKPSLFAKAWEYYLSKAG
ncbi:class II aldolase/adducin family protein [Inquilinus sp.]|jgi:L-fuculose-phosphate aldolase|uniref:class II aldolase/adducin family protein n=1 Tax=Inquilinus sp. TaxID=1932117 RepID=UPI003782F8D1